LIYLEYEFSEYMQMDFITGEKIQEICDLYFGEQDNFDWNPRISCQEYKQRKISDIISFDNPKLIFCYTHLISQLFEKIEFFNNPFILVSHNSDFTINEFHPILDSKKLIHWFSQNVNFLHPKLTNIPIGLANSQWGHGDLNAWNNVKYIDKNGIYFYFNIDTNPNPRNECKNILVNKGLKFGHYLWLNEYVGVLNSSKYSICPIGNGIDCHRVWESLYSKTIPICIRSVHTEILAKDYPIILLDSWESFDFELPSLEFTDEIKEKLTFEYYKNLIVKKII